LKANDNIVLSESLNACDNIAFYWSLESSSPILM
jgi:hypothetical protein